MRLRPALGAGRPGILGPMDKVLVPVRDLTDSDQNQAVLDVASALVEDQAPAGTSRIAMVRRWRPKRLLLLARGGGWAGSPGQST